VKLSAYLERRRRQIDRALDRYLPAEKGSPSTLTRAMRHTVFAGGKRIRPILAMASAEAVSGVGRVVMPFACALEMIHTYSLIHDDLPAMDDDDLRRGQPTCHVVFGEGIAILAGDALLTEAFRVMADAALRAGPSAGGALRAIAEIARAAGCRGMVGGQTADLEGEDAEPTLAAVEFIHVRKTGALLLASVRTGALLCGAKTSLLRRLTRYGERLGLAFQIADDVLDAEGGLKGKHSGRDQALHKMTFPSVIGVAAAKERARDLIERAVAELSDCGREAEPLRQIALQVVAPAVRS
jgi:geranylgeranyl diphosphate synthase type II